MKYFLLIFSIALSTNSYAQVPSTPPIVQVWSDKATYSPGQTAALMGQVNVAPASSDYQYYVSATLNGFPIELVLISTTEFAAITPALPSNITSLNFVVNVYLETVAIANNLSGSIAFFKTDLENLYAQLQWATDPAVINSLNQQIARDKNLIADLQQQQVNNRTLFQTENLTVTAGPLPTPNPVTTEPSMTLTASAPTPTAANIVETLTATVTKTYTGEDGNQENIVQITQTQGGVQTPLIVTGSSTSTSNKIFTASTAALAAGTYSFSAHLYTRSIAQTTVLNTAITTATTQRTTLINNEATANDPDTVARLQSEVNNLSLIINAYYLQLQNALIDQGAVNLILSAQ